MKDKIIISQFKPWHQNDIDEMMKSIAQEFEQNILTENYKKIIDLYQLKSYRFWVALINKKVVGTIGLFELQDDNAEIKKMFLHKSFRGLKIGYALLETLTTYAKENKYRHLYLGTMSQFIAAQKFYEKNQFKKINQNALPKNFTLNSLDSIFYTKKLHTN